MRPQEPDPRRDRIIAEDRKQIGVALYEKIHAGLERAQPGITDREAAHTLCLMIHDREVALHQMHAEIITLKGSLARACQDARNAAAGKPRKILFLPPRADALPPGDPRHSEK